MKEWIIPYVKENIRRIFLSVFIGILAVGSGAMLLFVSGYLISKSALMPVNIMAVYVPIVSVRAFSIGRTVFAYLEKLISHDIALRILEKMRRKLYDLLEPKALFLRSKYQTGDLLGVLSDDIEHLQDLYLRTIFPSVVGLAVYTVIVMVFGAFNLAFGLIIALLLGVIVFILPYLFFYLNKKRYRRKKEDHNKLYSDLTDAIFGMSDWKASGLEQDFLDKMEDYDDRVNQTDRKIKNSVHLRDGLIQLIIGLSVIAVLLWTNMQVQADLFSPTVIAAFVLMTLSIGDALVVIPEAIQPVTIYEDSIERIERIEKEDFPSIYRSDKEGLKIDKPVIKLKEVSYQYPGEDRPIIDRLNLTIQPGEKVALLGRSGAGKSTLLKLLAGALSPSEGEILIGGQEVNSNFLAHSISVLNQKPHLFSSSVANNLRIGKPEASEEEIKAAAEKAQLTSLIESLPEGFGTDMQEMGHRFSGGERQRVAFARVLLQDTPIMLADEATIGLDPVTERNLLDTIFSATNDKTVFWVTHHLAGVEQMDRVIFLEEGNITMDGSHEELMRDKEHYRRLYEMDQGTFM